MVVKKIEIEFSGNRQYWLNRQSKPRGHSITAGV
jgi:hypothetical protein